MFIFCWLGYGAGLLLSVDSVVISSIGFGGGVVAIVYPIQLPMPSMAMKAMATGAAISQN